MLQNRANPFGDIIKTPARGSWTGTRGVIHNHNQEIIRSFKLKAWLTCRLEFKGRQRKMMSPDKYTELFFLDEVTAFAAGHRPCCECRREDFNKFKSLWLKGNPVLGFNAKISIQKIDEVIHAERINKDRSKVIFEEAIEKIPAGTFVMFNKEPFLIFNNLLYLWTPFGYGSGISLPAVNKLMVLTPASVVKTFREGYLPQISLTV